MISINKVPKSELDSRMSRFRDYMTLHESDWEFVAIFSKINQYYFTGTMQDGVLLIPRNEEATLWVRQSYERALNESNFPNIEQMGSYKNPAAKFPVMPSSVHMELEKVPFAVIHRFQKYFPITNLKPVGNHLLSVRSIKSNYELAILELAGKAHAHVLEDLVPKILIEGMSEVDLACELYTTMVKEGHQGVARFGMFDTEILVGHVCFGNSSIYPTYFNGPGGNYGMSPAVPLLGNRDVKLKNGDLVFIDVGFGIDGYHTDKTQTYMYGSPLSDEAIEIHNKCVEIEGNVASMLVPGAIPSEIYNEVMSNLDEDFLTHFMGHGKRQVKFLGHGVGLLIDEFPVIAKGFDDPIQENMVFAVEPKKGISGVGAVGIENTYIVKSDGAKRITGDNKGLIQVF